jgi:hypothetical protein
MAESPKWPEQRERLNFSEVVDEILNVRDSSPQKGQSRNLMQVQRSHPEIIDTFSHNDKLFYSKRARE